MENEVDSFDYITVHIGQSPVQLAKETSFIEKNLDLFKNKKSFKILYDLNCRVQINKKQKEFLDSSINQLPCIWSDSYDEYGELSGSTLDPQKFLDSGVEPDRSSLEP